MTFPSKCPWCPGNKRKLKELQDAARNTAMSCASQCLHCRDKNSDDFKYIALYEEGSDNEILASYIDERCNGEDSLRGYNRPACDDSNKKYPKLKHKKDSCEQSTQCEEKSYTFESDSVLDFNLQPVKIPYTGTQCKEIDRGPFNPCGCTSDDPRCKGCYPEFYASLCACAKITFTGSVPRSLGTQCACPSMVPEEMAWNELYRCMALGGASSEDYSEIEEKIEIGRMRSFETLITENWRCY